jgi:hypothetical protein
MNDKKKNIFKKDNQFVGDDNWQPDQDEDTVIPKARQSFGEIDNKFGVDDKDGLLEKGIKIIGLGDEEAFEGIDGNSSMVKEQTKEEIKKKVKDLTLSHGTKRKGK